MSFRKKTMDKLSAAILGCGKIAGGYDFGRDDGIVRTHAKAYDLNTQICLTAVYDPSLSQMDCFQSYWPDISCYLSVDELLNEQRPDIVSICSPDHTHLDLLYQVLKCDSVKGVWCEKPLCQNISQAHKLVEAYRERDVALLVNYQRRWDWRYLDIRDAIDQGRFGEIQKVVLYYTKGIFHNGSHGLDLAAWWFGPGSMSILPGKVIPQNDNDFTVDVCIDYEHFPFYMIGLDSKAYDLFEISIWGTRSAVRANNSSEGITWFRREAHEMYSGHFTLMDKTAEMIGQGGKNSSMETALKNLVDCIHGNESLECSGSDSLVSLDMATEILNLVNEKANTFKGNR